MIQHMVPQRLAGKSNIKKPFKDIVVNSRIMTFRSKDVKSNPITGLDRP
jgi:hypothetical protein